MTVRAIAGLVLFNLLLAGVGLVLLWALGAVRWWADAIRLAGLAYLLALASLEVVLTLELVLGIPVDRVTGVLTGGALLASVLVGGLIRRRALPASRGWRLPRISLFVATVLAGIVVYFAGLFRQARLSTTLAEWDGWAHWVPKAKAIFYLGRLDPELLEFLPPPSYPPGLPAVHALAFHAMGSADDVTLHLQYWFYALAFVAATAGLLAPRVRQGILAPVLVLVLLAPSFVTRMTWSYVDLPLGFLVAISALLVFLWIEERQTWLLVVATVLLSGAMLTKREGLLLAGCVVLAGFAASWRERRSAWPRLAVSALAAVALALPWRIWFTSHGFPGDGPSGGYLGALHHLDRGWPTVKLVVTTLFDTDFWLLGPTVALVAVVLAAVARAWTIAVYAGAFTIAAMAAGTWIIWSEASLPITQDDAQNPVVRLTGTSILVLVVLTPAMLDRAWSVGQSRGLAPTGGLGPDAFVWRSTSAWIVVLAAVLVHPISILTSYSGLGLPGGPPEFPAESDCVEAPAPGAKVRLVLGYARSFQEAGSIRALAATAGIRETRVAQDGCGRLRVSARRVPAPALLEDVVVMARSVGLKPTLERDTGG